MLSLLKSLIEIIDNKDVKALNDFLTRNLLNVNVPFCTQSLFF